MRTNPFHGTTTREALRAAFVSILAALVIIACTLALGAQIASADYGNGPRVAGRPVTLSEASIDPAFIVALPRDAQITPKRQCARGGYFTEVSAYGARGQALGGQEWVAGPFPHDSWQGYRGSVTFDGLTFRNHTARIVLVAGWCS